MPVPVGDASVIVPVETEHKGCTTEPIPGAFGVAGWELISILADAPEVQPLSLVTANE